MIFVYVAILAAGQWYVLWRYGFDVKMGAYNVFLLLISFLLPSNGSKRPITPLSFYNKEMSCLLLAHKSEKHTWIVEQITGRSEQKSNINEHGLSSPLVRSSISRAIVYIL